MPLVALYAQFGSQQRTSAIFPIGKESVLAMYIDDYSYLWTTEKKSWVLVAANHGYAIVNKDSQTAFLVCNDELADALAAQMLKAGNKIYANIIEAYDDANAPDTTIN